MNRDVRNYSHSRTTNEANHAKHIRLLGMMSQTKLNVNHTSNTYPAGFVHEVLDLELELWHPNIIIDDVNDVSVLVGFHSMRVHKGTTI